MKLALDIGEKRTGVAFELDGRVVRSGRVEADSGELESALLEHLAEALSAEHPFEEPIGSGWEGIRERFQLDELVVGLPLTEDGEVGEAARRVKQTAGNLAESLDLELTYIDERYSSRAARASQLGRPNTSGTDPDEWDAMVAAELLKGYLEGAKPVTP